MTNKQDGSGDVLMRNISEASKLARQASHETTIGLSDALEQSERPVMGVEHHLLRLARVARINSMRRWQKTMS